MDLITGKLLFFVMVITRISAFFLVVPVFSWQSIPLRVKVSAIILLALFFAMINPMGIEAEDASAVRTVLLLANEATYGLALGLIVNVLFSAVKLSGRIVERQMGLAMAQVIDPLTGERSQPLGSLIEMIFVILFLAANGHHLLLLIIQRSYEAFPAGNIPTIAALAQGTLQATSAMFTAALRLAAPMLAVFLILLVTLAILARIVPEMNILFISFPVRIFLGLLMIGAFMPLIGGFVREMTDWMGKLLPL